MVQFGLCTLLMTLDKSAIFSVIPKDNNVYRPNFYVNIEKFTLFHGWNNWNKFHDRLSYWSPSEEAIMFIFNSKAAIALAISSTFLPEVFKPGTDK